MALTASISLDRASATVGQSINATVVVSNSGGSNVNILEIDPTCIFTGNSQPRDGSSALLGKVPLGSAVNPVVPAGGSATFKFSVVINSPSTGSQDLGSGTYSVSCNIIPSDSNGNSFTPASAATVTVHPVLPLF